MGFTMPHVLVLAGAGVAGVALILQIVGLATPEWTLIGSTQTSGLWKTCSTQVDICVDLPFEPDWLKACRAFGILAVLAIAGSLFLVALICLMSQQKVFGLLAPVAVAAGGVCCLIEFAVYAGESGTSDLNLDYGYSFALTIVACILCFIAAVLLFLGKQRAPA